eukprot:CAMPEP_0202866796 /NCGR_PEP_ID=MMETSP1391-20130828/8366_1 /ASSEMBLY_ACC=CAM_ASM_000867 /TAXON_ID=1034604 /ORGANISM="Chlamydomonas leiostraca, Strain SAG 11-49" /LENGTH=193 /DNA_ID=CAMNT_0049546781 /DNA_START=163 /DNA_END=744 /DNA_ORIENTATION=-
MPLTKQKAIEACYDETVVHDEKERGRLLELLERLPDEIAVLRPDTANEAIVAYLRAKLPAAAAAQPPAAPPAVAAAVAQGDVGAAADDIATKVYEKLMQLVLRRGSDNSSLRSSPSSNSSGPGSAGPSGVGGGGGAGPSGDGSWTNTSGATAGSSVPPSVPLSTPPTPTAPASAPSEHDESHPPSHQLGSLSG